MVRTTMHVAGFFNVVDDKYCTKVYFTENSIAVQKVSVEDHLRYPAKGMGAYGTIQLGWYTRRHSTD